VLVFVTNQSEGLHMVFSDYGGDTDDLRFADAVVLEAWSLIDPEAGD